MPIVVRKGDDIGKVSVSHWWPGRSQYSFRGNAISYNSPFPSYIFKRYKTKKTKYMTMVRVVF